MMKRAIYRAANQTSGPCLSKDSSCDAGIVTSSEHSRSSHFESSDDELCPPVSKKSRHQKSLPLKKQRARVDSYHSEGVPQVSEESEGIEILTEASKKRKHGGSIKDQQGSLKKDDKRKSKKQVRDRHIPRGPVRRATFPEKLMEILNSGEAQNSISWLADGNSFVILCPTLLTNNVLPKHFKEAKFESFTRKLNRWGFKRISADNFPNDLAYFHHLFQRNFPELCGGMSGGKKPEESFSHLRNPNFIHSLHVGAPHAPAGSYETLMANNGLISTPSTPSLGKSFDAFYPGAMQMGPPLQDNLMHDTMEKMVLKQRLGLATKVLAEREQQLETLMRESEEVRAIKAEIALKERLMQQQQIAVQAYKKTFIPRDPAVELLRRHGERHNKFRRLSHDIALSSSSATARGMFCGGI